MAAVTISVGGIAIELGDEDRSAKYLTRLAKSTIHELVDLLGAEVTEESDG
jgi:hypothetical protein